MDSAQFKALTVLKTKVRALKIESIRMHGEAFKMEHEYEQMVDEVKLSKISSSMMGAANGVSSESFDSKVEMYYQVSQSYLNLLLKISRLKPLEQVNTNFATLLSNVVSQLDKVQRKTR